MESLLNFYYSLFGIEVAIFSVISAVILVFIQLVYSKYSFKHIGHLLKNIWISLFFFFSVLGIFLTSAGAYSLTLDIYGVLLANQLIFQNIFLVVQHPIYITICFALLFISTGFLLVTS